MFIRVVKKQRSKDSKVFFQYTLAQAARVDGKVKQRAILYLGSSPLMKDKGNRNIVLSILKAKIFGANELFPQKVNRELQHLADEFYEKYCLKYGDDNPVNGASIPPAPARAEFHNIDIKGLEINDVKTFGAEHLCKQILDRLELEHCFASIGMNDLEVKKSLVSIAARAIFSSSEHKTAQYLQSNSELQHLYNIEQTITHKQLYTIADKLYAHRDTIDNYLYNRLTTMFNLEDKLVIFDISNTYFETRKQNSKMAKYGRSKEKRGDCPIVVFTGVINKEGFIRHSKIYEGNKADMSTLDDMITDLEKHTPKTAKQTVVLDAGIATEKNLKMINEKGYKYVCVSRKRLSDYPKADDNNTVIQLTDRDKNEVRLSIFKPSGHNDTWMYVQSESKRKKESSMNDKLKQRYEEDLLSIQKALTTKGGTKKINKVWERIGRAKQKNNRISANYIVDVVEENGTAVSMQWSFKVLNVKEDKTKGVYFIRTNYDDPNEKELWEVYNTIREVEATFRCLKTDLNIRPVHHQNDYRIKSHIYLTILAYQLVNTIRHYLKSSNIHHDWKNILRIMNTQTIQTIVLPTDKKNIHLRKPSKPIDKAHEIYKATQCEYQYPAQKKYVVYH